jgi:hypothetical protein
MRPMNQTRLPITAVVMLLALGPMLASCAADWASNPAPYAGGRERLSTFPVGNQTGRLTVVALDFADGRPLNRAMVDLVGSSSGEETYHYRRTAFSNQFGMVTFNDVPRSVDVFIRHSRGLYAVDGYPVPQTGTSEFRVYIETVAPRQANE